jgi:hypothetical protein
MQLLALPLSKDLRKHPRRRVDIEVLKTPVVIVAHPSGPILHDS